MVVLDILKELCTAPGVSGREEPTGEVFRELILPHCGEIKGDALGNLWGAKAAGGEKSIVIEAHGDKIGLIVSHIMDEGFVLFAPVGGFDPKVLSACAVKIYGKKIIEGVICALPPHIKNKDDKKVTPIDKMCIDTGFSKDDLEGLVSVGDVIEISAEFTRLGGEFAAAPACDDRAGLASLVKCMEILDGEAHNTDVYALMSSGEEIGLRGAPGAVYKINPSAYICVDVCHGKTPDASENTFSAGGGVVITVGPNITRSLSNKLISLAKKAEIPYQIDVDSGNTGTNAWAVQVVRRGIPTALLSIPLRYMHSGYEVVCGEDILSCAWLMAEFIKEF